MDSEAMITISDVSVTAHLSNFSKTWRQQTNLVDCQVIRVLTGHSQVYCSCL